MASVTFDGDALTITIGYDGPQTAITAQDIYSRWKDWTLLGDNLKYLPAFAASVGGNPLGGGLFLSGYFFLRNDLGWRIIPAQQNHELQIGGDLYPQDPDDDFVTSPGGGVTVLVTFQRSAASYLTVTDGTGGGTVEAPTANENAAAVWDRASAAHTDPTTMGGMLRILGMLARNKTVTDPTAGTITVYDDDGVTPLFTAPLWEDVAGTQRYRGEGADRRDRLT